MPRFLHHARIAQPTPGSAPRPRQPATHKHTLPRHRLSRGRLRRHDTAVVWSLPHPRTGLPLTTRATHHTHTHTASSARAALAHHRCSPDDSKETHWPVFSMRCSLALLTLALWPRWVSCGVASRVIATKGPKNEASAAATASAQHPPALPQASPPIRLWIEPGNGATCGDARTPHAHCPRRSREGGGQWMTLKLNSLRGHRAALQAARNV